MASAVAAEHRLKVAEFRELNRLDHPNPVRPAQRLSPRRKKSRSTVSSPVFACSYRSFASCSRVALRPAPPANTFGSPSSSSRFHVLTWFG